MAAVEAEAHVDEDADQLDPLEQLAARELTVGGFPAGVVEALAQPLDTSRVKRKPGQGNFEYIGHADIRRTLNRIFGYGGWGYTTDSVTVVTQAPLEKDGKTGVQVCAVATVTLRLRLADGSWLEKGGTGEGTANGYGPTAPVDAPGKAVKEAESDALKRAAINLGDQFGLILYAKEERKQLQAEAEYNAPASDDAVKAVIALAVDKGKIGEVEPLLHAEAADYHHIRTGKLKAIQARLEALPDAGAQPEAAASAEAALERREAAKADAAAAEAQAAGKKPLPDGQTAAPDTVVMAARSMAVKLGEKAVGWFDEQVQATRKQNEDAGYGAVVTQAWADGAIQLLSDKLAAAGLDEPEGDVTPAEPAKQPDAADVASAFGVDGEQKAA